jgi:hypothetical protein
MGLRHNPGMKVASSSASKPATYGFFTRLSAASLYGAAIPAIVGFLAFAPSVIGCGDYASRVLFTYAREAVSADPAVSSPAIAALREEGPRGLNALVAVNQSMLNRFTAGEIARGSSDFETWDRLRVALDAVGKQRDCYASKLYWFTDLDKAKKEAQASGKPILSLRLLGNLDEDLSCANSRFFRTTLYANTEVANYLRQHFILHWKSVRPVPKVTIDFGDGRKLQRTITGNSIHYVLDSSGEIVDALPGLYGAQAFLAGLRNADETARKVAALPSVEKQAALRDYHKTRLAALEADWRGDLGKIGMPAVSLLVSDALLQSSAPNAAPSAPSAQTAARLTASKSAIEAPLLRGGKRGAATDILTQPVQLSLDDGLMSKIALLHAETPSLDASARALLRTKGPNAQDAMRATRSKGRVEDPMLSAFRNLEVTIAEDTVRNEYVFHSKIHQWLADDHSNKELEPFNSRVYAQLFLTPDSDPYLGLVTPGTCSAIDNDGQLQAANR